MMTWTAHGVTHQFIRILGGDATTPYAYSLYCDRRARFTRSEADPSPDALNCFWCVVQAIQE